MELRLAQHVHVNQKSAWKRGDSFRVTFDCFEGLITFTAEDSPSSQGTMRVPRVNLVTLLCSGIHIHASKTCTRALQRRCYIRFKPPKHRNGPTLQKPKGSNLSATIAKAPTGIVWKCVEQTFQNIEATSLCQNHKPWDSHTLVRLSPEAIQLIIQIIF